MPRAASRRARAPAPCRCGRLPPKRDTRPLRSTNISATAPRWFSHLAAEDLGQVARSLARIGRNPGRRRARHARIAQRQRRASGRRRHPRIGYRAARGRAPVHRPKLIAALTALSEAAARAPLNTRDDQADVVLLAASIVGLAVFARAGRLKALGFDEQELIARLDRRFTSPAEAAVKPRFSATLVSNEHREAMDGRPAAGLSLVRNDDGGRDGGSAVARANRRPDGRPPGPGEVARRHRASRATRPSSIPAAPR